MALTSGERQARRGTPAEAYEQQIYDGHHLFGTIATDGGAGWLAFKADGDQFGEAHPSALSATDTVLAAARNVAPQ